MPTNIELDKINVLKASVLQENLRAALKALKVSSKNKPSWPVLENVLIEAQDGKVTLHTTDLETTGSITIGSRIEVEGSALVSFAKLSAIMAKGKTRVDLDLWDDTLKIERGNISATMPDKDYKEYPPIPTRGAYRLTMPVVDLKRMVERCYLSAASDDNRPVLTVICTTISADRLQMDSADGYRLTRCNNNHSVSSELFAKILIPAKPLFNVMKQATNKDDLATVSYDSEHDYVTIEFTTKENGHARYSIRLLTDMRFPDVDAIMPTREPSATITVDQGELIEALTTLKSFAPPNGQIKLSSPDQDATTTLTAKEQDTTVSYDVDSSITGAVEDSCFNVHYLIDAYKDKAIKDAVVSAKLWGKTAPMVASYPGPFENDYQVVLMPMSIGR